MLIDGFYYLHFRLRLDRPPGFDPGPGIADDPFYRVLERTWMLHQLPIALLLYRGRRPALAGLGRVRAGRRLHDDALVHLLCRAYARTQRLERRRRGHPGVERRDHGDPDDGRELARQSPRLPGSARHGLYPGQIDIGYRFIQLLELLGLAWNVKLPANLPPRPGITPLTARALAPPRSQPPCPQEQTRPEPQEDGLPRRPAELRPLAH